MKRPAGRGSLVLGPRTTVWSVLETYPFLEAFFAGYHEQFGRLGTPEGRGRWARVASLEEVALAMDVTWRRLARDIAAEVARTGAAAPAVLGHAAVADAHDHRVDDLRDISARLEDGGSLLDLAKELERVMDGAVPVDGAALERAAADVAASERLVVRRKMESAAALPADSVLVAPPEGHPLHSLRREGAQVETLCADLSVALERLGGSPSRRRWRAARPLVARLVDRLSGVEARFRRQQQAWFPALEVLDVRGPAALLADRQAEALESLRRLRLAVARDDAAFVVENGARLLDLLGELLATEEQVLVPLAQQRLAVGDWVAVRELEDGVGWELIATPPPWPSR
ncbi:MAG TPA: hemerythrin domain-containing protein [Thermoleophilia bacterium]|nr:hemerythrin domain-containing protein [Thermoleophilia bacterium]